MNTNTRDWEELAILQELRFEQKQREMWLRFGHTQPSARQAMARRVVATILPWLLELGYPVNPTTHKCPFDLWVGGCRVEVKGSHWRPQKHCYQASVRNHEADILIFDAINGADHFFIIPMADVSPRATVEITSYDVTAYKGRWIAYLERRDILQQAVNDLTRQLPLGGLP